MQLEPGSHRFDKFLYMQAVSEIAEFPWLLTSRMDLESIIYLCQIFTILSDNATAFSEHSWLGRGMQDAPKYLLGWLMEVLADDRKSSKESREYILPCLVATLTRYGYYHILRGVWIYIYTSLRCLILQLLLHTTQLWDFSAHTKTMARELLP